MVTYRNLPLNLRHPVILPSNDTISHFLTHHIRLLHIGYECMRCFRFSAKPQSFIMGNFPTKRTAPSRPFLITSFDYAEPILLRDRKDRNLITTKVYIALFVSFSSKAIHVEIVTDLTSECFFGLSPSIHDKERQM